MSASKRDALGSVGGTSITRSRLAGVKLARFPGITIATHRHQSASTVNPSGRPKDAASPKYAFNDGKVDAQGRFIVGTFKTAGRDSLMAKSNVQGHQRHDLKALLIEVRRLLTSFVMTTEMQD